MIDFYQIQQDILAFMQADATLSAVVLPQPIKWFIEAMDREFDLSNMPFINVRLLNGNISIRSIPNGYYGEIYFEVDVVTFDFSEFKIAAKLRDDLLKAAMSAVRSLPRNVSSVDSWKIGPEVRFGAGTPEQGGGHMAVGTFGIIAEVIVDAT